VLTLVRQAEIPYKFSETVNAEAANVPDVVTDAELVGRLDLRNELIFTIDGDDTKDIDDGISFAVNGDGSIKLGVHIADVSHYVKELSALDESALSRGTSVYLADRVIPMLPHKLSSGICSLFPNVDRLTLSCVMTVNSQGHVTDYEILKSVINSKKRWTYNEVQNILDGEEIESDWRKIFTEMNNLREILRKKREAKGALDFNLPEAKIRVDETGKPISVELYPRNNATGIIEEFMILCNETVAAHFLAREIPFVYRTHEAPGADKLAKLSDITQHLGYTIPKSANSPVALQRLLEKTANTSAAQAIATAVLHSLPQARYTPNDPTHYGLASQAYCHFTSPIRRYADLQIHRIIKAWLSSESLNRFNEILPAVCAQCSQTERAAEALEREVEQLKKVQFMASQTEDIFSATVSGVTPRGVYVMLANTIEGIIPFETLRGNKFVFDKEKFLYIRKGQKKSKNKQADIILRHGDKINVRFVQALEDERKIIFAPANP
jgi:ribonuclease R